MAMATGWGPCHGRQNAPDNFGEGAGDARHAQSQRGGEGFAGSGERHRSRRRGGGGSGSGYSRSQGRGGFAEGGGGGYSRFAEGGGGNQSRGRRGAVFGSRQRGRGRWVYGQRGAPDGSPRSHLDADDNELRISLRSERGRSRTRGGGARGGRGRTMYGAGGKRVKKHVSIRSLSLCDIMELRKLHPSEIVSRLSSDSKAFQRTLEQDQKLAKQGIMSVLVEILLKVAQCFEGENAQQASLILAEVLSERCSSFHLGLKQHVSALKSSGHGIQAIQPARAKAPPPPSTQAQSLCMLFQALLTALPNSSWCCLPVDELADALHQMRLRGIVSSNLDTEVQEIVKLRDEIKESTIEKRQAQSCTLVVEEDGDDEEFRNESILPKWEEICHSDSPSRLRANIISGSYTDWNHYYDIHFRLLREDFIAPFRRGVCDFMKGVRGRRLADVKIYHNMVIFEPICTRSGISYSIKFDVSCMKHCNWEHSKHLKFGSLLCLSPDDFRKVIFFAVVSNRDPKELKDGKLQIEIEEGKNILPYCKKATRFTMVESLVYFEASKHILHSLQTAEVDTMPFTQYLIKNRCDSVCAPKYLDSETSTTYDLSFLLSKLEDDMHITPASASHSWGGSCLLASGTGEESDSEFDTGTLDGSSDIASRSPNDERDLEYYTDKREGPVTLSKKGLVDVLDRTEWPHISEVELDASQLQAIQMALTQEIAVIQGPPGTGKTYIGLKIVEALLRNRKAWDPYKNSPILVMCLTNHALDQFLEGIIQNTNLDTQDHETEDDSPLHRTLTKASIVRVGKRSKSEIVQKHLIDKKRSQVYIPRQFREARRNCEKIRSVRADMIQGTKQKCKMMSCTLVPLLELEHYVDPEHMYQFLHGRTGLPFETKTDNVLQLWLGLAQVFEKQLQKHSTTEDADDVLVPYNLEGYDQQHFPVLSTATFVQEKLPGLTEEDSSLSNSDDSESESSDEEDTESIDIEREVIMEEPTRMLDDEADAYGALTMQEQPMDGCSPGFKPDFLSDGQQHDYLEASHNTCYGQPKLVIQSVRNFDELVQCGIKQPQMTRVDAEKVTDVYSLTLVDRWRLYNYWLAQAIFHLDQHNRGEFELYNRLCKEVTEAQQKCDRFILETADIIGMTTTGAAKNQHILHLVKPKIVIVEEAAEVLESHVVSALNAGTQHLILIGDHKQLRPKPNEYNLAKKYKLDVSLFERLVRNGFPRATLQIQHRMRPQIARLVHPHIYDTLMNHESVLKYEDVKGVVHNLFFLQHSFPEKVDTNLISHSNPHEARYLAALCKYLLHQGYKPAQITILVTYTGQVLDMMREMPTKDFEGVKLTTVDNFQGEENDIILLSLVRSNPEEIIGFLREENRVCVALSRARMGLYCIGNFKMLRRKAPIWEKIISDMESKGHLGDALSLYCVNHPNTRFAAKIPGDFSAKAPKGGCTKDCDYRLGCGHVCAKKCHIDDLTHMMYQCQKPCARKCPNGHPCKDQCCKPCKPCTVKVSKVIPDCSHEQLMHCRDNPSDTKCLSPCPKKCASGHACPEKCWQKNCSPCRVEIDKVVPQCGHKQGMACHRDPTTFQCRADCEKKCPNGHPCSKHCYKDCGDCKVPVQKIIPECQHEVKLACHKQPIHTNCLKLVDKVIPKCGHKQSMACHVDPATFQCRADCEKKCPNGHPCSKHCYKDCGDCKVPVQKIIPECQHKVELACHKQPIHTNCFKACERTLSCGHHCPKRCGLPCRDSLCMVDIIVDLKCGHKMKMKCPKRNTPVALWYTKPCSRELVCGHRCKNKCRETCTVKCEVQVNRRWPCGHTFKRLCYQAQDLEAYPCSKPCNKQLPCGHKCVKRCYEECTKKCKFPIERKCPTWTYKQSFLFLQYRTHPVFSEV